MKLYVYSLYNAYLGVYDRPIVHEHDPETTKELFRRTVLQDPDGSFKNFAHEKRLCFVGTWDDLNGEFVPAPSDKERFIADLAPFFPAGYLAAHTRKD